MKAIPERVKEFAEQVNVSPYRYYVEYLDINRNKPVMRTFAYQNTKTNGFRIQEVLREYLDHTEMNDCFYYGGAAGWCIQWKGQKTHSYYWHNWASDFKFYLCQKRPNIYASQIQTNAEYEQILKNYIPYFYLPENYQGQTIEYARAYKNSPNLELLAKAGYSYFATDKMMMKCKGQRMKQMIKWMRENAEYVETHHPTYQFISMALKNHENGKQCYERCCTMNDKKYLKQYGVEKTYEEVVEIRKYLDKQDNDITTYKDYLQMSQKLGRDMNDKSVLFPRDLQLQHDSIQILLTERDNKALTRKLKNKYKKFVKYACECGELKIVVPETPADFINWGKTLHNCVGSNGYCQEMANGRCIIIGVFRNNKIVECCELNKKLEIVQLRGNHNQDSKYHKKAKELVNVFINNLVNTTKIVCYNNIVR